VYHAIVFLPLLGAILGGLITVVGGYRARRAELLALGGGHGHHGHDDHAHAKHDHHDDHHDDHDDHGPDYPIAPGARTTELITTGFLMIAAVLSWIAFFQVGLGDGEAERIQVLRWITSGAMEVDWAFRIDTLTVVMLVVVNTVSSLVHLYSIGYMHEDAQRPRFFTYLSLFTFAMLMLVTSDNLVQMFFGWEGVGLASYLLIGFWYYKPEANAAAIKAFVVNRVGDFGFALGVGAY
jgi:NADH-quinone oxidoreductase subunit L